MTLPSFVLKGDICYSETPDRLACRPASYLVCENGICRGVFAELPEQYRNLPLTDCGRQLILPGMSDLHVHAPQFAYRGLGMDLELLDWLYAYAFPEETKYRDNAYARRAYGVFTEHLKRSATTRAVIFGTVHREATEILMEQLDEIGLPCFVGKLNMDRDCPDDLREPDAAASAAETERWILETRDKYRVVKPVITPRFLPSCTDECLRRIGELAEKYGIPVQSHLSENPSEMEYVQKLFPDIPFYGEGYNQYGLFGQTPTVMAHCIYSVDKEVELMRENGVYVAHCPSSNMNLCSGIAPIRRYLDLNLHVGLGSDVAAGESESIFGEIRAAIAVSKLRCRYIDPDAKPLSFAEAFYLATLGGGEFFGKVGSFAPGYAVDLLVLDDEAAPHPQPLDIAERLERSVYLSADKNRILAKFADGVRIF